MLPGAANGGIKFAILQLLEGLLERYRDQIRLTLFVPEITRQELAARFENRTGFHCTRAGRRRGSLLREACREVRSQSIIRRLARREKLDVLYSPFGRHLPVPANVCLVALIMDLLHEDYPKSLTWKDRFWRRLNLRKLAFSRARFQVPSEFTRQRLKAVYRIPYARTFRTYLLIHERLGPGRRFQAAPFFFYPARPWKHKNQQTLLRAFRLYRERAGTDAWRLVLIAGDDQRAANLKRLAAELELSDHVDFTGDVNEEQLAGYYRSAAALVFPSYYEGFGIPLLEAMHFGLPIICGRGGSQTEVAGAAALYVDVDSVEELAGAMRRISCDADLRQRLAHCGQRQLARFVWRSEVQTLADAFRQASDAPAGHPGGCVIRQIFLVGFDLIYALVVVLAAVRDLAKPKNRGSPTG
ncbi:MAG: glycosyltransferase family 4 protein [Verrucomicrobia bacterium]|nr:glycosyltransferase family 4 protein [Verrucomicrobiota bacterium]